MRSIFVLAQSTESCQALEACWSLFDPLVPPGSSDSSNESWINRISQPAERKSVLPVRGWSPVDVYRELAPRLAAWAEGLRHEDRGVVLVDVVKAAGFDPLGWDGWSAALAMLVLTFPDLHWCFGTVVGNSGTKDESRRWADLTPDERILEILKEDHGLSSLACADREPLFDYSGLTNELRQKLSEAEEEGTRVAPYLPRRNTFAVAVDDEHAYAYLHAYAAYRQGFRSLPVTADALAKEMFGIDESTKEVVHLPAEQQPSLSFEDLFLAFPDANRTHYSDLANSRAKLLPGLGMIPVRVFVTTGQRHGRDAEKRSRNAAYIEQQKASHDWVTRIFKPVGGLFDLWQRSGLDRQLSWPNETNGTLVRGVGRGFVWPPRNGSTDDDTGHSAPGRLLLVAEQLLERARWLRGTALNSVPHAVRGAVMATNALELLGDRNPTTSIEALSLKQQFEVGAECYFSGVEYHIAIEPRMREIRAEVQAVSRWFHPSRRQEAADNAEMTILNSLIRILRDNNQFEEEEACMNRERRLHHNLWMRQKPFRKVLWPILRYMEALLASGSFFFAAIAFWIVALGVVFYLVDGGGFNGGVTETLSASGLQKILCGMGDSVSAFTGATVDTDKRAARMVLQAFTIFLGLGHLGIFISKLYSRIARK